MEPLSNLDANGAEEGVIASEVSSFQRLKCMQEWYFGWEMVSCLERCPQFKSVLILYRGLPLYASFTSTYTIRTPSAMPAAMLPTELHMSFSSAESLGRMLTLLLWKFWRICGAAILILILVYWMYGGIIILLLLIVTVIGGLYHYQDSLLYYPEQPESARVFVQTPGSLGLPYENVCLTTKDGCRIMGYFIKQPSAIVAQAPTVLYFHGNAGNIGHRLHNAQALYRHCGFNIFLLEYRGYGKSQGTPSEFGECKCYRVCVF